MSGWRILVRLEQILETIAARPLQQQVLQALFLLCQRGVQVEHSDYCQIMVLISPSGTGTDCPLHLFTDLPDSGLRQSGKALQSLKL